MPLEESKRLSLEEHFFEAEKQRHLGNTENEERELLRCLDLLPNHPTSLFLLGCIYANRTEYSRAAAFLKQATISDPGNQWYWTKLVEVYKASGNFEKLGLTYESMTEVFPQQKTNYLLAATFFQSTGKYAKAIQILKKGERQVGITEDISIALESVYLSIKQPRKALKQLQKLQVSAPSNTRYMGLLADLYIDIGKEKEGIDWYLKILELDPQNGLAHFAMAEYYESHQQEDKMVASILSGLADPRVSSRYKIPIITEKLPVFESKPNLRANVPLFWKTLEQTHPNDAEIPFTLGNFQLLQEKYREAATSLAKSLDLGNRSEGLYTQLILADYKSKQYDNLLKHAVEGINEHPQITRFYYYASLAYTRLGEYHAGIQVARDGLELSVFDPLVTHQLLKALGNAAFQKKEYRLTDSAYEAAFMIDSADITLSNNLAYLLALENNDLQRAERLSKRALKSSPDNPAYLDTHGYVLYRMGQFELAGDYMQQAISAEPDNGLYLEHLGDIYYKQGKKAKAMQLWKQALEKYGKSPELELKIRAQKIIEP